MFGLFKKVSEEEKVQRAYRALLEEAHRLSTVDRRASDLKRAEAEEMLARFRSGNGPVQQTDGGER